jgi:hypothetical protein
MRSAPERQEGARGPRLLLEHCVALTRIDDSRPPPFVRLEQAVGGDLARLLVAALAAQRRRRVELAA